MMLNSVVLGSDDADEPALSDGDVDAIDRVDAACSRRMKYVRDVVEFDPHRPGHRGELYRSRDRRIRSRPVLHSSKSCFAVGASRKNQQRRRIWRQACMEKLQDVGRLLEGLRRSYLSTQAGRGKDRSAVHLRQIASSAPAPH